MLSIAETKFLKKLSMAFDKWRRATICYSTANQLVIGNVYYFGIEVEAETFSSTKVSL